MKLQIKQSHFPILLYCSGELRSPYFINCNAIFVNGTSGKPSPTEVFAGHYNNVIIGYV